MPSPDTPPSWGALFAAFGKIGLASFGGPAAQIAVMHRELVDTRGWLADKAFLGALSFCMLLPGPEAMQLATYTGWMKRGLAGGLLAGLLFVLPGAVVIGALALLYLEWGNVPLVQQAFFGIKALVVAIVVQALVRLSGKALEGRAAHVLAIAAFLAIFAFGLPFPLIVLTAGLWGYFLGAQTEAQSPLPGPAPHWGRSLGALCLWAVLWQLPVLAIWLSGDRFLFELARFFSLLAGLSFGGAYALLAWMTQVVVQDFSWLTADQMIDALGLAETTPGPLILVTQFVGMLAAALRDGPLYGVAAGALVLWVTFVPSFAFIFTFAPHVERLLHQPRLAAALRAITAAVVGVIASLAIWFTLHVIFDVVVETGVLPMPDPSTLQLRALLLILCAFVLIFALKVRLFPALALMALAGIAFGANTIPAIV
ncbi:chromate efflux transporter [Pseudooceanicola sp. HF7]|uniref:chromate efflux transporter n=1 Tax=Pseudooceanicola sp. HF7 TaxID=2721560 RepID=UPI00142F4CD9|nr:chromate efflux transporter [Pseudooceanicola sp. HF7]NIZ11383.1 chromate efflux transporter [Pseudooceanicola sp. HF7]